MRQALADGGPDAAAARLRELIDRFGADRVTVELTHHGIAEDGERNADLAELAQQQGLRVIASTAAHFAGPPRRRLAMAMAAVRARQSLDDAAGHLAPAGERTCGPVRRWRTSSPRTRKPCAVRRTSGWSVRSTCGSSRRNCHRSTCPTGTPRRAGCGNSRWTGRAAGTVRLRTARRPTGRSSTNWTSSPR